MAKHVATDRYIAINGTAYSDHFRSIEINDQADKIDFTGFSSAGYKQYGPGLKDAAVTGEVFSDFAASQVNAVLQTYYSNGGTFTLEVRPTSAAVSATNPKATMTASLYSYSGIAGAVGDAATFSVEFANAGTAGLVWGTA